MRESGNEGGYGWNSLRAAGIMFIAIFGTGGALCLVLGILYLAGVIK